MSVGLRKSRKENKVMKEKLMKNDVISWYKDKVIMAKFKNKRDVLFISSEACLKEYQNKKKQQIIKPIALHYYDEYMNRIDHKNQMLAYYSCSRRTFK